MRGVLRFFGFALLALCVGGIAISGYLYGQSPQPPGAEPTVVGMMWLSSFVGFPAVGAVIVWKLPRNALGWMLAGIGASIGLLALAGEYAKHALLTDGDLPGGEVAAWVSTWIAEVAIVLILLLLIFFPRGRPRNKFWQVVTRVVVGAGALLAVLYAIRPGKLDSSPALVNPLGIEGTRQVLDLLIAILANLLVLIMLAAIVDKVIMFRMSRGDERQQIKWFALSALMFPILFALSLMWEVVFGRNRIGDVDPVVIAFLLGFNGMAVAIGVAVFKYRLYDVGTVVNRTLVYGSLTAILGAAYVGLVFAFQELLSPVAEGSDLAIAGSTLAVAALVRPVRSSVQAFIDHRFYRRKFDVEQTVQQFAEHVRDEVELTALSARLQGVVLDTMQPAHVSLWLRSAR